MRISLVPCYHDHVYLRGNCRFDTWNMAKSPGFGLCGTAETICEALQRRPDIKNLTGVSNNAGDGVFGLAPLVKSGQIEKMILSYVGTNKNLQDAYLAGKVALELSPQGTIAERLRAAAAGMPGFYTRTGAGACLLLLYHSKIRVSQAACGRDTKSGGGPGEPFKGKNGKHAKIFANLALKNPA